MLRALADQFQLYVAENLSSSPSTSMVRSTLTKVAIKIFLAMGVHAIWSIQNIFMEGGEELEDKTETKIEVEGKMETAELEQQQRQE